MLAPRVPAQRQASLCLPTSLAFPTYYFAALCTRANHVCPTLGAPFSCLHALMPFVSARHSVALCLALAGKTPQGVRLCPACAGASGTHVCSARYLQPPPFLPCVSARHLLYPSLAFPTSFCHLCLRKVSCALPQHVMPLIMSFSCLSHELLPSVSACALPQHAISPSLPLASMCAVYNIPSRTHTEPAPQCRAPGPDKQLCVAVSSSRRCFQHSCLRHTWRPPQLLPWPSLFWRFEFQINATKCEAVCSLCRCF